MNSYENCPRCPLCPHLAQYNIQQLARHLCTSHHMKNSATILARTMLTSQMGYQEVAEVLKDVGNLTEKMVSIGEWRCKVEEFDNTELDQKNKELDHKNKEFEHKIKELDFKNKALEVKNIELSKLKVSIVKADQFSQTDPEYVKDNNEKQIEAIKDIEIEELQQTIAQKKISVGMLKSQISETETEIKTRKDENFNPEGALVEKTIAKIISKQSSKTELINYSETYPKVLTLSQSTSLLTVLRDELDTVKDISLKKDEQIASLISDVNELEVELKLFGSKEKKLQSHLKSRKSSCDKLSLEVDKLDNEKKSDKNVSTQLIESQRIVHEKEIQDLNLKLQNQINRSQGLKSREKSLMEEVETLNAITWKRNDQISSLTNQVNILQVKSTEHVDNSKKNNPDLKEYDTTVYSLHERIAFLHSKAVQFEKEKEKLKNQLSGQSKENLDLKHCFDNYKKVSQENISEKDKMLSSLEKELESTKADAEIIVEEIEKCSSKNIAYEKTIVNMKMKFGRYREIIGLMKDSLTGLAAMHGDTSDKLIEAVKNTARASKVVVNDFKKQFKVFEKEIARLRGELVPVDKIVENNNLTKVKKEPEDSSSSSFETRNPSEEDLGVGKSSKNAKRVAQDLSREFEVHFGERDEGKRSLSQESVSGDDSGRKNRSRSNKKRKFIE